MRAKLLGCDVESDDTQLLELLNIDAEDLITAEHFDRRYPGLLDAAFEAKDNLAKQKVKIRKFIITDRSLKAITEKGAEYEIHGWRRT